MVHLYNNYTTDVFDDFTFLKIVTFHSCVELGLIVDPDEQPSATINLMRVHKSRVQVRVKM